MAEFKLGLIILQKKNLGATLVRNTIGFATSEWSALMANGTSGGILLA